MNAAHILARAEAAGVTLTAAGDRLRLVSATPPPTALLHDLAGAKAELLELLQGRADEAADREAIEAAPQLPPIGTLEREKADAAHRLMLAGLLAASHTRIKADG